MDEEDEAEDVVLYGAPKFDAFRNSPHNLLRFKVTKHQEKTKTLMSAVSNTFIFKIFFQTRLELRIKTF